MAKLEQKARKGLYGGFKPGSTGGPGTGKIKNTVKRKAGELKRAVGDVASNVKKGIEARKTEKATEEIAAMGSSKNPRFLQDALNPAQNAAMLAGGSRPMHQGTSSQIDPMTGMPIMAGGQPPINPAFGGAMANSGIPNFNPGMNMGAIAQARLEMSREQKKDQIMSRNLPEDVKQNMIEGINQEANDAKKDGTLVARIGEAAAKAAPKAINMRILENVIVPDTSYKIGNKKPRKSMVVKRNK